MSTLTKVLIVLLTISSIFVCGIVVTYVANAVNYKSLYTTQSRTAQTARADKDEAERQLTAKITETDQERTALNGKISELQDQVNKLQNDLLTAQRDRDNAILAQNNAIATNQSAQQTNEQQRSMLENTQTELKRVQSELTKVRSDLKETNNALLEKMSIVAQQDERIKLLVEEKSELQNKLDQILRNYGKEAVTSAPVAPRVIEKVQPAAGTKAIGLKGLVTRVDAKNLLAQISIGTADGVKENMKFHVTRGDEFICDILILDVDTDKAVGILDRVQQQPKSGDNVSTNL